MASSDTEILIRGANRLAKQREEQRAKGRARKERRGADQAAILRELDAAAPAEVEGVALRGDNEISAAFGLDQDELQNYSRDEKVRQGVLPNEFMTEAELAQRSEGADRPDVAPKSVLQDALKDLDKAEASQRGLGGMLSRVFSGGQEALPGAAQARGRLEDDLRYGREQIGAEKALAGEAVRRDLAQENPELREYNNFRAQAEAESIARDRFTAGGGGAIADEILARERLIGSLGAAKEGSRTFGYQPEVPSLDAVEREGVYTDPTTGLPVETREPAFPLAGSNTPDSSQQLNAPRPTTAVDFVAQQVNAADNQGIRSTSVDISEATGTFSKAFEGLGQDPRMGGSQAFNVGGRSIRTIDELQSAIDAVVRVAGQQGVQMFRPEQVKVKVPGGSTMKTRQRPVADPDAGDVMNFLGLSSGEQRKLADAMVQLSQAKELGIRPEFFSRQPTGRTEADIIRLEDSGVGQIGSNEKLKGKNVRAMLAKLEDPDAQRPFGGVAKGETAPRAAFARAEDVQKQPAQRAGMAPAKREIVEELERREAEESQIRRDRLMDKTPTPEPGIIGTERVKREQQLRTADERGAASVPAIKRRNMSSGAMRALDEQRGQDRSPLPNETEADLAQLIQIARRRRG